MGFAGSGGMMVVELVVVWQWWLWGRVAVVVLVAMVDVADIH